MQNEFTSNQKHLPNDVFLEVCSSLDSDCAQAIVEQAKESLQNGSATIVVDLSKNKRISLLELAVLVDRANNAGVLEKVAFQLSDAAIVRFFVNIKRIRILLRHKR